MSKIRRTTRYSPQHVHNQFGVQNWLKKHEIFHEHECNEVVKKFCESKGFKDPEVKKKIQRARHSFVQNRFDEFCQFVTQGLKEGIIQKSN